MKLALKKLVFALKFVVLTSSIRIPWLFFCCSREDKAIDRRSQGNFAKIYESTAIYTISSLLRATVSEQ